MKTEQGEIPALFSCWEAWGGAAPSGLTRRLRRGSRACSPVGRSIASGGGRSEGAWGRAESPQCARRRIPPAPLIRRLPEGVQGGTKGSACPVGTTAEGG